MVGGCFATDIVAWFIIVACAATLFKHQIQIETAKEAAIALRPLENPLEGMEQTNGYDFMEN